MIDIDAIKAVHPLPWEADETGDGYVWDAAKEIVGRIGGIAEEPGTVASLSELFIKAPAMLDLLQRNLNAWEDEEDSVREEHQELIKELRSFIEGD